MAKIDQFFGNKELIKEIAKEVAEAFKTKATKDNVEYSFDISQGMITNKNANTQFSFDPDPDSKLNLLKKALFADDLAHIEQGSKEEDELMDKVTEFIRGVCAEINFSYEDVLQDVIRNVVLPNSKSIDIPLETIEILSLDIADYDSVPDPEKYMLRVGKVPDSNIETSKVVMFIHNRQEDTGKTVQEIFEEEKLANPLFEFITSVEIGEKFLYDINVILFIDYSLSKMPPEEASIREEK